MTRTYTSSEEAWLRENYHAGTINDTLAAFEAEFGRRPSKQALFVKANKMGLRKDTHHHERRVPAQARIRWSEEKYADMREWMLANDRGESVFATIDAFEEEFGIRLNRAQVSRFRSVYGTGKRVGHGGGKPSKPVGSEREGKDGYVMVKVREYPTVPQTKDNWRFKHWIAWEEANGRPVPDGCTVFFADGDKRNYDPGNLVLVPRKYIGQLNNPELPKWHDRETLLACIALCDMRSKLRDAEMGSKRTCEVCGAEFAPTARQREYSAPVRTCPDCLAAGRKARGDRGDKAVVECVVCGEPFARCQSNQRRCPECLAAKPRYGAKRHAEFYARNGHR
jgi:uncharacterized CHY-type Zn-finger protein